MGETAKMDKVPKTPFFKGVQVEFKKISWPDKTLLFKQSIAVVIVSVVLGIVISLMDVVIQYGVKILTM